MNVPPPAELERRARFCRIMARSSLLRMSQAIPRLIPKARPRLLTPAPYFRDAMNQTGLCQRIWGTRLSWNLLGRDAEAA